MNHKRKKPSEPREFACNWRMDGLLKKEEDAAKAAWNDTPCSPKPKTRHYKNKKQKRLLREKVCCKRCGFYMGMVDVEDHGFFARIQAISKKFGSWYSICDNCKKKRRAR